MCRGLTVYEIGEGQRQEGQEGVVQKLRRASETEDRYLK